MEVVVLSITNRNQERNSVNNRCCRRVLPEVTSLVSAKESFWLDCWCCASRELLVEADYALHADGILCSTDSLFPIRYVRPD